MGQVSIDSDDDSANLVGALYDTEEALELARHHLQEGERFSLKDVKFALHVYVSSGEFKLVFDVLLTEVALRIDHRCLWLINDVGERILAK